MNNEIGVIGAFRIALLVTHWNQSNQTDLKDSIRVGLLSGRADRVQKALELLGSLLYKQFEACRVSSLNYDTTNKMIDALTVSASEGSSAKYDHDLAFKMGEKSDADIAFYFATMFNHGHFDKIPLPQIGLVLEAPASYDITRKLV